MVRKIVGTLIDVGRGKLRPEDIPKLFELRDRSKSGPTMPPHGLCLAEVEYPKLKNSPGCQRAGVGPVCDNPVLQDLADKKLRPALTEL
jgi:tRNA U38,U39,U40 pseudouridine synthase TruA